MAKELPTSLETADDYVQVCENFVLPLFYEQSKKIVKIIKKLHEVIGSDDIQQELIDQYINEIKELASFANKDSTMNPYFQNVARLEQRLEEEGYFTTEEST